MWRSDSRYLMTKCNMAFCRTFCRATVHVFCCVVEVRRQQNSDSLGNEAGGMQLGPVRSFVRFIGYRIQGDIRKLQLSSA